MMWKRVFFGAIIGTGCAVGGAAKVLAKTAQDTILKGNPGGMQNIDLMEEAPKGDARA